MSKWEMVRLSDIYDITSSKRVFQSEWTKSGVPFYRAREIAKLATDGFVKNELFISDEMYKVYSEKYGIPQSNDIMITGVGTLGVCYVVKENDKFYFKDGNIIWLKAKSKVQSQYIKWAFQTSFIKDQIQKNSSGSTVGTYTITNANDTIVPLPPLEVQRKIAETLDAASELLAMRKNQLAELDKLIQSVFYDMFGDPVTNEKGWQVKKLGEISENLDSKRIPITSKDRNEGIYPYYGASGIVDYVNDYIFDEDLLLISEDGANLLARVTPIAFSVTGKVWVNNHAHILKFTNYATQLFVEYLINQIDISSFITGSAQPKLNQAKLNNFNICIPPIKIQTRFAETVQKIEEQKALVQKAIDETQALFDSLMNEYFE